MRMVLQRRYYGAHACVGRKVYTTGADKIDPKLGRLKTVIEKWGALDYDFNTALAANLISEGFTVFLPA
jgi:hypothetical protein